MFTNQRILLIDDEPKLLFTLGAILRHSGYEVITATTGQQALACLSAGQFELVILDLCLPDMDGLQLLERIQRQYAPMPVLILTGEDDLDVSEHASRLGVSGYLLKPINPGQILQSIELAIHPLPGTRIP